MAGLKLLATSEVELATGAAVLLYRLVVRVAEDPASAPMPTEGINTNPVPPVGRAAVLKISSFILLPAVLTNGVVKLTGVQSVFELMVIGPL